MFVIDLYAVHRISYDLPRFFFFDIKIYTTIVFFKQLHLLTYAHTPTKHTITFMWCDIYLPILIVIN